MARDINVVFNAFTDKFEAATKRAGVAMKKAIPQIVPIAKAKAPKDDGFLKQAIEGEVTKKKGRASSMRIGILKDKKDEKGNKIRIYAAVRVKEFDFLYGARRRGGSIVRKELAKKLAQEIKRFERG